MRTASLSIKQAIGILALEFAALWLFADVFVSFFYIIDWFTKVQKFHGIGSIIGLFIGAFLVFIFVVIFAILGIWLVRDKHGMDLMKFAKG